MLLVGIASVQPASFAHDGGRGIVKRSNLSIWGNRILNVANESHRILL